MPTDIVVPKGNEKELLEMAQRLGYKELIFAYNKLPKEKIGKTAFLAKNSQEVNKNKNKFDYIIGGDWGFNDKRVDIIYGLETEKRKDYMHHRASGMNQVVAKQAKQHNTSIAFNFNLLRERKELIMGRFMQNIKLCRKYKVSMIIASFASEPYEMRAPKDLQSLGVAMGMHPKEAKDALNY
ncbi:RNase P subunit p30 family protein [Nanoarchaeota archaeon]